jgi:hypothetical protein
LLYIGKTASLAAQTRKRPVVFVCQRRLGYTLPNIRKDPLEGRSQHWRARRISDAIYEQICTATTQLKSAPYFTLKTRSFLAGVHLEQWYCPSSGTFYSADILSTVLFRSHSIAARASRESLARRSHGAQALQKPDSSDGYRAVCR